MITRFENRNSIAGGNGTTNSIAPGDPNRAYATLAEGLTAEIAVMTDDIEFLCTGAADDITQAAITGYSGAFRIYIRPQSGDEVGEVWDDSKYSLQTANQIALLIQHEYVTVENIQIGVSTGNGSYQDPVVASNVAIGNEIILDGCMIRGHGESDRQRIVYYGDPDAVVKSINCITYNVSTAVHVTSAHYYGSPAANSVIYNGTCYGGRYVTNTSSTNITIKNTIGDALITAFIGSATNANSDHCFTNLGTAVGGLNDVVNVTDFFFEDEVGRNFALTENSTMVDDEGEDLSADSIFPFDYDALDNTRTNWSGGALEYISSVDNDLVATDTEIGAPTLGTPEVTQLFDLVATDTQIDNPVLGVPVIEQPNALNAISTIIGDPLLGSPVINADTEQYHNEINTELNLLNEISTEVSIQNEFDSVNNLGCNNNE